MPHLIVLGLSIWAPLSLVVGTLLGTVIRRNAAANASSSVGRRPDPERLARSRADFPTGRGV